ncbi:MAG: hypothetical protein ABMA13_22640 [Chthoniobacteraceae bacterium]
MPDIPHDLAAKVVDADTRNVVVGVGEKVKLTAAMRREMKLAAMTPALADQQRAAALLAKYCDGEELTAAQWEEIRRVHPGFASAPPPPGLVATGSAANDAEGLTLANEPRPGGLSMADAKRFGQLYKGSERAWRTIYRWLALGEAQSDPCPLADATKMPAWWNRRMSHRCPPEIEQAAVDAARATPAAAMPDPASAPQILTPPASLPASEPAGATRRAIKLEEFDPIEGARLRSLQQLEAAKFDELTRALAAGDSDAAVLETRWVKLCDTVDKIESRITERMQRRGLLVLREEVDRDLAATAELFRQSRESMKRRVLERCSSLNSGQRTEVGAAIDRACDADAKTFAQINTLKTHDLLADLAA